MTTKFHLGRDISGYNSFAIENSTNKYSGLLTVGVADSVTVPSRFKKYLAIFAFEPGSSVWVAINAIAIAPAGAFSSTSSDLNPTVREVNGGDSISFITTDTTAQAGVMFYAL